MYNNLFSLNLLKLVFCCCRFFVAVVVGLFACFFELIFLKKTSEADHPEILFKQILVRQVTEH